jgi:hypothetical protein
LKLPNGSHAIVEIAKLREYCLNLQHPYGRHKARVFRSALGLDQSHAEELRQKLLDLAATADAVPSENDDQGQRYMIDFTLAGPSKMVPVRSCWIVLAREDFPRLTTCYVLKKKMKP